MDRSRMLCHQRIPDRRLSSLCHQQRLLLRLHVYDQAVVWIPHCHYDTMVLANDHTHQRRRLRTRAIGEDEGWETRDEVSGEIGHDCEPSAVQRLVVSLVDCLHVTHARPCLHHPQGIAQVHPRRRTWDDVLWLYLLG